MRAFKQLFSATLLTMGVVSATEIVTTSNQEVFNPEGAASAFQARDLVWMPSDKNPENASEIFYLPAGGPSAQLAEMIKGNELSFPNMKLSDATLHPQSIAALAVEQMLAGDHLSVVLDFSNHEITELGVEAIVNLIIENADNTESDVDEVSMNFRGNEIDPKKVKSDLTKLQDRFFKVHVTFE